MMRGLRVDSIKMLRDKHPQSVRERSEGISLYCVTKTPAALGPGHSRETRHLKGQRPRRAQRLSIVRFPPGLVNAKHAWGHCRTCFSFHAPRLWLWPANVIASFRPVHECFGADLGHGLALLICINVGQTVEQRFCF
jgi:hypothetical protein